MPASIGYTRTLSALLCCLVLSLLSIPATAQKVHRHAHEAQPSVLQPSPGVYHTTGLQLPPDAPPEDLLRLLRADLALPYKAFSVFHSAETPYGRHFQLWPILQAVPVWGQQLKINQGKQGRLYGVLHNLHPVQPANAGWQLAAQPLADSLKRQMKGHISKTDQFWFPVPGEQARPAWRMRITECPDGSSWDVLLDASTGKLLQQRYLGLHFAPANDTDALGFVFDPDPLTTAEKTYGEGGNYIDDNDADRPELNDERLQVTLRDLAYDPVTGQFRLQGPYVRLEYISGPMVTPVIRTDENFFYTRSESGFEDVMAYYHIDNYQRFVQSQGFPALANYPLRVDPHGYTSDNSAVFPNGQDTYMLIGEGGVDDGEDADVILHEYGHVLSYFGSPETNIGNERRGLDEGLCDYIALSYSYNKSLFDWEKIFTWDGHNPFWPGRTGIATTTYQNLMPGSFYDYGEFWAAVMMEIEQEIGRSNLKPIFFQSLYMHSEQMSLPDAAKVLLDAEQMVTNGLYAQQIASVFCARGLLTQQDCQAIARPEPLTAEGFALYPNPAQHTLQLRVSDSNAITHLQLIDATGKRVLQRRPGTARTTVPVAQLGRGLYIVQVTTPRGVFSRRVVLQ